MSEINSQFFNGKTYSATDFVESNKNTMKDGILPNTDFFKVLPSSNRTIGVTSGRGWVQGHAFSSGSTLSFTLDSADGVLDRVDTIVIRLDLTTGNEKIECKVIKGALGGSATAPVRDGTYYDLVIAHIAVAHGTTAITAAMITDKRGDGNLCGWSGAISGDQFNFDVKANKTYCDDTFALKTEQNFIVDGTIKTNAVKLQGKIIATTAPTVGQVLQFDGTQYKPIDKLALTLLYSGSQQSCGIILTGYATYTLSYVLVDVNGMTTGFYIKPSEITDTMDYRHIWGKYGLSLSTQFRFVPTASNTFGILTYSMSDGNTYGMGTVKIWGLK